MAKQAEPNIDYASVTHMEMVRCLISQHWLIIIIVLSSEQS